MEVLVCFIQIPDSKLTYSNFNRLFVESFFLSIVFISLSEISIPFDEIFFYLFV